MAESIIVHFGSSSVSELPKRLNLSFNKISEDCWKAPVDDYSVIIRPYHEYTKEYEKDEREAVEAKLAEHPQASYEFEIRRSKSDEACEIIEQFIRTELSQMNFVIDDMKNLYSSTEIEQVSDFLDQYRYQK